jgi:hypothetical protein
MNQIISQILTVQSNLQPYAVSKQTKIIILSGCWYLPFSLNLEHLVMFTGI